MSQKHIVIQERRIQENPNGKKQVVTPQSNIWESPNPENTQVGTRREKITRYQRDNCTLYEV